jgi:hypothetical protein
VSINKRPYHPPELKKYRNVESMPSQQRATAEQLLAAAKQLLSAAEQLVHEAETEFTETEQDTKSGQGTKVSCPLLSASCERRAQMREYDSEQILLDGKMIDGVLKLRDRLQQLTADIPDNCVIRFWQAIEMAIGNEENIESNSSRETALGIIAIYLYNSQEMARLRREFQNPE